MADDVVAFIFGFIEDSSDSYVDPYFIIYGNFVSMFFVFIVWDIASRNLIMNSNYKHQKTTITIFKFNIQKIYSLNCLIRRMIINFTPSFMFLQKLAFRNQQAALSSPFPSYHLCSYQTKILYYSHSYHSKPYHLLEISLTH